MEGLAQRRWTTLDDNTGSLQSANLGVCITFAAANNSTYNTISTYYLRVEDVGENSYQRDPFSYQAAR